MASLYGVHRETYGRFERGDQIEMKVIRPEIDWLEDHEKCFILRRRAEKTQEECAAEMGITRYWFNLMEQGKVPAEPLIKFWGQNAGR